MFGGVITTLIWAVPGGHARATTPTTSSRDPTLSLKSGIMLLSVRRTVAALVQTIPRSNNSFVSTDPLMHF